MKTAKKSWPAIRIALFLCIGLMNTVLIRPEEVHSFKHGLGFVLLALGLIEGAYRVVRWIRARRARRQSSGFAE